MSVTAVAPVFALGRNRCMLRVLTAWLLFVVNEYATWTAVLVYAFERHGTTGAALASLGQLLPAAVCAPAVAALADRRSPSWLLRRGLVVQVGGLALGATVMIAGGPQALAFAGAVVAATAVVAVRPSMALVIPGVAAHPAELAAANAVVGWLECIGTILAGLVAGVLLTVGGPRWVLAASAVLVGLGLVGFAGVRVDGLAVTGDDAAAPAGRGAALGLVVRSPRLRVLLAALAAAAVVLGTLDVLFVVLAGDVLGRGLAWAGYLTTAFGVGGVLAVAVTVVVLGRGRLGRPVVVATLVLAAVLAGTAAVPLPAPTVALVVVAGAAHAVVDVVGRTLLQRVVPPLLLGRVFGLVEAATMAAMALGAVLVPLLDRLGGSTAALLGVALVGPLALLSGGRAVRHLDDGHREPLVELSLLRRVPAFDGLGTADLRALAATAVSTSVARGGSVPVPVGAVVVVGAGTVERPDADGGPPITRHRGEVLGPGFVARTAVTVYVVDPPRGTTTFPARTLARADTASDACCAEIAVAVVGDPSAVGGACVR